MSMYTHTLVKDGYFIWISVQFSLSVMSNSLLPHGLQHAKLPCPLQSPGVCSDSCPLNRCCRLTISSPAIPFSSCLRSFPALGSLPVSQFFASGGQSIGASASVLLMNIQGWFPLVLTGLISLLSKGLSSVFSSTTVWKQQFFGTQPSLWSSSRIHTWLGKIIFLTMWTFAGKVMMMTLCFKTLTRFVIAFLPKSQCLFISWLQSLSHVVGH